MTYEFDLDTLLLFLRRYFLPILFCTVPLTANGQDTFINAAETLAYGIFTSSETEIRTKPATRHAPPADDVNSYRFRDFTNRIPMVRGTEFGIEYQINSKPRGRPIEVTTVILFPDPGLSHPGGRVYKKSKETKRVQIGEGQLHGYGFDEDWELVPGEWVFEVWHKKARLVRKSFTVFNPKVDQQATHSDG